ncbi:MAG: ABC transporter permease [Planctomycetes bacterium]|nr:ABC transporter permease [Planctomycetota bacterium]
MRELLRFLPYVLRTALRARLRSLCTVLGAALAMALFVFVRTVDRGVDDLSARSAQPVLVVFQDSRFCPLTSELPVRYAQTIRDLPEVEEVLPTLVYVNSCRSNLDLVTLHGVEAERLSSLYELEFLSGSLEAFRVRSDAALIGERLAERRKALVGQRVRLGDIDVEVAGIVRGPAAGVANLAFVHLAQLSLAQKRQGSATQFLVRVKDGVDPEEIAAKVDEIFRTDEARTDTKSLQAFVAAAVQEVAEIVSFGRVLGYLAVLVVALVLANTVFISAQSRAPELAVLETIGLTKPKLLALIAGEGVLLGLAGGLLGTAIVLTLLWFYPLTLGVEGWGIDLAPSLAVAGQALLAALLIGLAASLGPAIAAARRPVHLGLKEE